MSNVLLLYEFPDTTSVEPNSAALGRVWPCGHLQNLRMSPLLHVRPDIACTPQGVGRHGDSFRFAQEHQVPVP